MQDNLPRMKAVLNKVKIDTRNKVSLGVLTGTAALSGLGAGLGAAVSHTAAGTAGPGDGTAAATRALTTARYYNPHAPREMYDSVTPTAVPKGKTLATYVDGPYAQPQAAKNAALLIDTNESAPAKAQVLDVEPGDATPASAATWVRVPIMEDKRLLNSPFHSNA